MKIETKTQVNSAVLPTQNVSVLPTTNSNTINNYGIDVKITDETKLKMARDLYKTYKDLYFNNPHDPNIKVISRQFQTLVGMAPRPPMRDDIITEKFSQAIPNAVFAYKPKTVMATTEYKV